MFAPKVGLASHLHVMLDKKTSAIPISVFVDLSDEVKLTFIGVCIIYYHVHLYLWLKQR